MIIPGSQFSLCNLSLAVLSVLSNLCITTPVQGKDSPLVQRLEPIVVSGQSKWAELEDREASSIHLVPTEDIQESRAYNLEDVFQQVPGVIFQSRGGANDGKLSIRGTNLSSNFNHWGVTLLVNGVPMGTADGFANLEAIDLQAVEQIEVYKGAAAFRHGGNTIGGAVNLILRNGSQANRLRFKGQGGSYGWYNINVATGDRLTPFSLGGRNLDGEYAISVTANGQHGYRTNNQHDALRLLTNIGLELGTHQHVQLFVANTNIASDLPGVLTKEQFEDDPQQAGAEPDVVVNPLVCADAEPCRLADYTQLHYVGIAFSHDGWPQQHLTVSPFYQHWFHDVSRGQKIVVTNQDFGAELRYEHQGSILNFPIQMVLGLSPKFGESQTTVYINDQGNRGGRLQKRFTQTINLGAYWEGQIDILPQWTVVAGSHVVYSRREGHVNNFFPPGIALDDLKDDRVFSAISPKGGVIYRLAPTMQVFGNISRVYEPPINIQLLQLVDVNALPPDQGLIHLDAQRGWQFELGFRGQAWEGDLAWDITAFDLELRNEILVTELTIGGVGEVPTFTNAGKTRHIGVEAAGAWVIGRHLLTTDFGKQRDQLTLRTSYTWAHYRFLDDVFKTSGGRRVRDAKAGNTIPGVPEHWITGELRYEHPLGWWLAPNVIWSPVGYVVDFQNTLENPPFFVLNLKGGYQVNPHIHRYVEGRNLTDQNYAGSVLAGGLNNASSTNTRAFFSSPGFSVFGGIEIRLP